MILVVYDDIVLTGNNQAVIYAFTSFLHWTFDIKDLGPLCYFVGIEIARSSRGVYLS